MQTDVLVLNTAVLDLRHPAFTFTERLAGPGGLAKGRTADLPPYTQEQIRQWIGEGHATAGGPGNTAPLMARAGLRVAVGGYLGAGAFGGLDAQGRAFHDVLAGGGVEVSALLVHPRLPTGTAFICERPNHERGGLAYFPNANDDFDFARFQREVERLRPRIVYYMYSGLSDRGDANGGRDLAAFMRWCRERGAIAMADSHTLTANPQALIRRGTPVDAYRLLVPLLPELDIFFTSSDEARMIVNTLEQPRDWEAFSEADNLRHALDFLTSLAWQPGDTRSRLFGITVSTGAITAVRAPAGPPAPPRQTGSRYLAGEVIDLVGAGDSFRAGLLTYLARHADEFRRGALNVEEAVQMGNLFASLFIKAPLSDRYGLIRPFDRMLRIVQSGRSFDSLRELTAELNREPAP